MYVLSRVVLLFVLVSVSSVADAAPSDCRTFLQHLSHPFSKRPRGEVEKVEIRLTNVNRDKKFPDHLEREIFVADYLNIKPTEESDKHPLTYPYHLPETTSSKTSQWVKLKDNEVYLVLEDGKESRIGTVDLPVTPPPPERIPTINDDLEVHLDKDVKVTVQSWGSWPVIRWAKYHYDFPFNFNVPRLDQYRISAVDFEFQNLKKIVRVQTHYSPYRRLVAISKPPKEVPYK